MCTSVVSTGCQQHNEKIHLTCRRRPNFVLLTAIKGGGMLTVACEGRSFSSYPWGKAADLHGRKPALRASLVSLRCCRRSVIGLGESPTGNKWQIGLAGGNLTSRLAGTAVATRVGATDDSAVGYSCSPIDLQGCRSVGAG